MARTKAVGFVAPSGYLTDPAVMDRAAQRFASRGWHVLAGDTCFEKSERFAGSDELRAGELQRYCTDRSLDLVVSARGGYGLTRLLHRLDFEAIARAGRTIVGYSDFTAFNLAYLARAGGISLHGPSAGDFGAAVANEDTLREFFATLSQAPHQVVFPTQADDLQATGVLWGGNLSLVCALLGTEYFPKVRGGILFLEDVNEPAYKIERMLLQLVQAGVLHKQKAIVLGAFDPITPMPNDNGYNLGSVIAFIRSLMDVPVVTGLPFGHVPFKVTLPVGAKVALQVRNAQASLSWKRWDPGN